MRVTPIDKFDDPEDREQSWLDREDGRVFLDALPRIVELLSPREGEVWVLTEPDGTTVLSMSLPGDLSPDSTWVPPCSLVLRLSPNEYRGRLIPCSAQVTVYPYEMVVERNYSAEEWEDRQLDQFDKLMLDSDA